MHGGPLIALGVALVLTPPPVDAAPAAPPPPLVIVEATWGGRCGAPAGNATAYVRDTCGDARVCKLDVDPERLGDPVPGCEMALEVKLACGVGERGARSSTGGPGERLVLSCGDVIDVTAATYGDNCGAPVGNVTRQLADACEGAGECRYVVDFEQLGDPAPGCPKRYRASWRCTAGGGEQHATVPPEAGAKQPITLRCPAKRAPSRLTVR